MSDASSNLPNPSFSLPNPNSTNNDLIKRLQTFLPQMKEANQALSASNPPRVDLQLESERDDDEADSDGDSNAGSFTHEEATSSEPFGGDGCVNLNPTIQVEFALGKLKDNPIMKLLADDDSSEENGSQDSSDREENVAIERVVTTLLAKDACSDGSEKSPLRKKPLITEL